MACQVLEVTLISAKDLKRVTFFSKMRVYAVASISGAGDPRLPTHRTYADREGGRNPIWHAPLRFTIPAAAAGPRALALHVLLRAERAFGDRDVGEVLVPVRDLAAAAAPEGGGQRHLSYQVRRPVSGRSRGVLHMSYRLTDVVPAAVAAAAPCVHPRYVREEEAERRHKGGSAVTAYPAAERRSAPHQQHATQYGYAGAYGYGAVPHRSPSSYGYGQAGAAPTASRDGAARTGAGLGLLGGLVLGDMMADAEVVVDGVGF